jgi:hypothetical protein
MFRDRIRHLLSESEEDMGPWENIRKIKYRTAEHTARLIFSGERKQGERFIDIPDVDKVDFSKGGFGRLIMYPHVVIVSVTSRKGFSAHLVVDDPYELKQRILRVKSSKHEGG